MSTPEEQQHQQRQQRQQDPYGTQTWQSDTWDTGYQPVQEVQQVQEVQPPLGALPGQPVAPEAWFRDEAQAPQAQAPEGWSQGGAGAPWPDGSGAVAEQAYLPPYPGPAAADPQLQPAAPEGWFRDEAPAAPAPAPAAEWTPSGGPGASWAEGSAAEQTAYLPPQAAGAAEQTAYLPPYPGPEAPAAAGAAQPPYSSPYPGRAAAGNQPAAAAAETAYLPPYPGPDAVDPQAQAQPMAPEGWFRDEAPAAPVQDPAAGWAAGGGSGAAWGDGSAAEQTAYLPPQAAAPVGDAAEQTAFLPPYPGPGTGPEEPAAATAAPAARPADAPAGPEVPGEEPAYSPPTLAGNTVRAVDPAQARAEGRSPIIDPGPQPAILTAALGLLLAGAAAVGDLALLAPLVALQALTAAGWFRLNGMWPARQGIALAFVGALVADGAVLAVDDSYGPGAIIGALGAWVLLTLVLQLRSHAEPDERMYGLMASVASAALAIACAGYLAADSAAVSVGAAAVAVAAFTRALPLPTPASVGVSLAAATGAGIAVGGLTSVGVGGALVGLVAGVCALIGLRVAAYDYPSKFVHMTAGVALPLAAAAPAVYLIGRVVG
ncbi:hypothetical protein ACIGBH_36180 [Streptomyces sp. NPDC085929]|uniref:hypothetical protein n=1 Tax=Streptomyces sp. NPDC085929 TaxID=3365739 RepID=UPI0037CF4247